MFQRGNEAFNTKVEQNTALKELRSFYLAKDKQSGNYIGKSILHLHSANDAVIVKIHELKMNQPDGKDKYIQALCMNELGKACDCCMKGMYSSTVAIYKVYDFTEYTSTQDNQTKQVGVRPMLAKKTQQGFITSLSSADPNGLNGRVITYNRSGQYGRDWNVQICQSQMNDQQLIQFQQLMGGYTNDEIMEMLPITDEKTLGDVLQVIARGGAGTANTNFNPNNNNGGGGNMNFNPNNTFDNGGSQNNNNGQNNGNNNGQNNSGGGMNFNVNNGQNNNYQTENNSVGQNNSVPDQDFNPDRGGSMGGQDANLGGGNNNGGADYNINADTNFNADDIPF